MSASPYGLSIVLDFEDNASEGMRNAANAFSGLSGSITNLEAGIGGTSDSLLDLNTSVVGMSVMGSSLQNMGKGLLGTLKGVGESVINTSSSFENFDITLQALYKSEEQASKVTSDLFKYATKSPFQVQDLQSMVVTLKSQGLEAFDELQGAQTGLRQTTMDWIGDLQAFRPGETALKWKRAIQNFLSGTNNKSAEMLRNILDVGKLDQFLGHDLHTTVEGRMQDLMEIVEKTGMAGMQGKLSKTWSIVISNMEDTWSQFAYRIGFGNKENSMYKSATNSARNILSVMTEVLGNSDFQKATSDAFLGMVSPIERLTEALNMASPTLSKFLGNHPKIVKLATGFTAVGGAALYATGSLLKMSAGALNWLLNVQRLGGLSGIFNMLSNAVNMLSLRMIGFGAVGGLVYAAWKGNFLGLRTLVQKFTGQFGEIFKQTYKDMFPDDSNTKPKSFMESLDSQGLNKFTSGLKTLGEALKGVGRSFREGVYEFFKFFGADLPSINAETFNLKDVLNDLGDSLTNKFGGDEFKQKWGGVFSTLGKATGSFGAAIGVVTLLGGAFKLLNSAGGLLATNLKIIGSTLVSPAGILGMGLTGLILGYQNDFLGLHDTVAPIVDKFKEKMKTLKESFGQKNADGKNTIFETIKSKMSELNKASKEWRTDGVWDYIDGSTMIKHQTEKGKSIGEVLAMGIASGLIAFGGPIQKAMGATMWAVATNFGHIREGASSAIPQLIQAKDLLLEMSTGYGPKSHTLAEKFGLQEFADGIVNAKNASMSFLKSFMDGFAKSNTIIGRLVKDLFPDLDFSVNGILNAIGRMGTKLSEFLGLDDKGNIAENYAQIAEKLGDIAAKAMLIVPAFAALKTAMNFGVNPLALSGISQSLGLIGSGFTSTLGGLVGGGKGVFSAVASYGSRVADVWKFSLQSALLQGGNSGGILGGTANSILSPIKSFTNSIESAFSSQRWKARGKLFKNNLSKAFSGIPIELKSLKKNVSTELRDIRLNAKNYGKSIMGFYRQLNSGVSATVSPTKNLHKLSQAFTGLGNAIKVAKFNIGSGFKNAFKVLGGGVGRGFKSIFSDLDLASNRPELSFDGNGDKIIEKKKSYFSKLKNAGKALRQTFNPFEDSPELSKKSMAISNGISSIRGGLLKTVAGFQASLAVAKFGLITNALKSGTSMFASAVAGATKMVIGLNGVAIGLATVTSLALAFGTLTTSDWQELNDVISEQPTLLGKVGAGWDWFNQKLAGTTSKVNEFIAKFDVSKFVGGLTRGISKFGDSIASIISGSSGSNGLADLGGRLLSQIVDGIVDGTTIGTNLQRIINSVTNSIQKYAPKIGLKIGDLLGKAFEFAGRNADKIFDSAFTILRSFMSGLLANKDKIVTGALNVVTSLATHLKENAPAIIGAARELITGFCNGLEANKGLIGDAMNSVIGPIYQIIQENLPTICSIAKKVLSSLANTIKSLFFNLLADIADGIAGFMAIVDGIITAAGAIMMFIPGLQGLGSTLLFKGVTGLAGDAGFALAGSYFRGIAEGADQANASMWNFNSTSSQTLNQTNALNKALGEIGNRETTFTIKRDGSVEELSKDLSQLQLEQAFGNHEIIYKTVLTGEGEVVTKAYEVQATLNSNGNIEYILVAKDDGSGVSAVDANKTYAEQNPMEQKLNIVEGTTPNSASGGYELTYNKKGKVKGYKTDESITDVDELTNVKLQAENQVKKEKAIEEYVAKEREKRNTKQTQGQLFNNSTFGFDTVNEWTQALINENFVSTGIVDDFIGELQGKFVQEYKGLDSNVQETFRTSLYNAGNAIQEGLTSVNDTWSKNLSNPKFLEVPELENRISAISNLPQRIQEIASSSSSLKDFSTGITNYVNEINGVLSDLGAGMQLVAEIDEKGNVEVKVKYTEEGEKPEIPENTESNHNTVYTETGDKPEEPKDTTTTNTVTTEYKYKVDEFTWNSIPQNGSPESTKTLTVNLVVSGKENLDSAITSFNNLPTEAKSIRISVVSDLSSLSVINGVGTLLSQLPEEKYINVSADLTSVEALIQTIQGIPMETYPKVIERGAAASKIRVGSLTRAINAVPDKSVSVTASVSGLSEVQALAGAINSLSNANISVSAGGGGFLSKLFGGSFASGGVIPDSDFQIMNEQGGEIVDLPTGSRVYPHDESVQMSYKDGMNDSLAQTAKLIASTAKRSSGSGDVKVQSSQDQYDYSVNFSEGSIIVQVNNSNGDTDYKRMAQKVYDEIQKKVRRDGMARRA